MALQAYFDTAGDARQPIVGVAGYIATSEQWQAFATDWHKELTTEGVAELHMKRFAHSRGEFTAWKGDELRRARFLDRLSAVIKRHTLKSVAVSLFVDHYNDFNKLFFMREVLGGPYTITAMFALLLAKDWRDEQRPHEPIAYLLEKGDDDQANLPTILRRHGMDNALPLMFLPKRGSRPDGSIDYRYPFQACDFFAYEIAKAGRTVVMEEDATGKLVSEIKARKSLQRLMPTKRDRQHRFIDTGLLMEFRRVFRVRPRVRPAG